MNKTALFSVTVWR